MDNKNIWTEAVIREIEGVGFTSGYSEGKRRGFRNGVICTVIAYGIYKIVDWCKAETKELDD